MYAWIALASAAGHLEVPASESRAVWAAVAALAGLELGGAATGPRAELLAGEEAWTLIVHDSRGERHQVEVPPPADNRARESLVWLAASLMDPLDLPERSTAPVPPPVATTVVGGDARDKQPPKASSASSSRASTSAARASMSQSAAPVDAPAPGSPAADPSRAQRQPSQPQTTASQVASRSSQAQPPSAAVVPASPATTATSQLPTPETRGAREPDGIALATPPSTDAPPAAAVPGTRGPQYPDATPATAVAKAPTSSPVPAAASKAASAPPNATAPPLATTQRRSPPPSPWIALAAGTGLRAEVAVAPHARLGVGGVFGPYRAALWVGATTPATLTTFGPDHTVWSADVSGELRWQPPLRVGPVASLGAGADVRSYLQDAEPVATTTPPFVAGGAGVALTFGPFDAALLARGAFTLVPTDLERGTTEVTEGAVSLDVALEVGVRFGNKP